jgi:hypothetical protein
MRRFALPGSLATLLGCALAFACGDAADDDADTGSGGSTAAGTGTSAGRGGTTGGGVGGGNVGGRAATSGGSAGLATTGGSGGAGGSTAGSGGSSGVGGSSGTGGTGGGTAGLGGAGGMAGAGGSAGTASGSGGLSGSAGSGDPGCVDTCPFPSGVEAVCKLRFMYGVNYAWQNFAADFGGGTRGITALRSTIDTSLAQMAANGVNVIRWWVWPNFTGGGVTFDGSGTPTGLTGTTIEDLETLLSLADDHDLYLMPTLFSFDNFKTAITPESQNMATLGVDAAKRAALVDNVVRPFARAAAASTHASRVIAWDVINEPEWAVTGASLYGDEAFDSDDTCTPISHAQMETLLAAVIAGLRQESDALVSVGAAAMKWKKAWSMLDQDFYQFHIYDWVQDYWPYDRSPTEYGLADKPVVMGEFPPTGLSGGHDYRALLDSWYANGYAGALAWRDATYMVDWAEVKAFADAHPCETKY